MAKDANAPISAKQAAFVDAYCTHRNAARAAREAGYSEASCKELGYQLLTLPRYANVQAEIARREGALAEKFQVNAERVIAELASIAFSRIDKVMSFGPGGLLFRQDAETGEFKEIESGGTVLVKPSDEIPAGILAAIESIGETKEGLKIKMHPKVPALVKLGEHLGLFKQKHEHEHNGQITVEVMRFGEDPAAE